MTTAADQSSNDNPHDEEAWWMDYFIGITIALVAQGEFILQTETFE